MKNRELIITNAAGTIAQSIAGIVRRSRWGTCTRIIGISPALFDLDVRTPKIHQGGGFRRIDEHVVFGVESMEDLIVHMRADDE